MKNYVFSARRQILLRNLVSSSTYCDFIMWSCQLFLAHLFPFVFHFAHCIHLHLLVSSLNSLSFHFQFVSPFFFFSSFVSHYHHVHHIQIYTDGEGRLTRWLCCKTLPRRYYYITTHSQKAHSSLSSHCLCSGCADFLGETATPIFVKRFFSLKRLITFLWFPGIYGQHRLWLAAQRDRLPGLCWSEIYSNRSFLLSV